MKIKISAPGKLMLLGEHAVVYGYPCIVTAVDKRLYLEAEVLKEKKIVIKAPSVGIKSYQKNLDELCRNSEPKEVRFIECAVLNFCQKYSLKTGVKIKTQNSFSIKYGFGSSAAVTVCTIKALSELFGKKLSKKEIFNLSYRTILDIAGVGSGFDIAAAIYGGILYFITGGEKIERIRREEIPLLVGYSGIKADTPTIVKNLKNKMQDEKIRYKIKNLFQKIAFFVEKGKVAIIKKNWQELGKLFNQNHLLLQKLEVSIPKLDKMCQAANKAGAYGAKLSGAGGGDCMIAVVSDENRKRVKEAIEKVGGKIIEVKSEEKGVMVEK